MCPLNRQRDLHSIRVVSLHWSPSFCQLNSMVTGFTTLGARDSSSAVSGFGTAEEVSAFGQHRKFSPQARKTSGTQGTGLPSWRILTVLYCKVG